MTSPRSGFKRPRSPSLSPSASSSTSTSSRSRSPDLPPPKIAHRRVSPSALKYTCDLPPTCNLEHTSYSTINEVERHQEIFHRWVCRAQVRDRDREHTLGRAGPVMASANSGQDLPESFVRQAGNKRWKECLKVFPEERFLQLHYAESHDPFIKSLQDRHEKIFECFLPPDQCPRKFLNPKKRRLHMIDKHYYPIQFFWAITNQGINEIAKTDGLAISLIRPRVPHDPKPRVIDPQAPSGHHQTPRGPPLSPEHVLQSRPPGIEREAGLRDGEDGDGSTDEDDAMVELTKAMGGLESSLAFVPRVMRGVKGRGRGRGRGLGRGLAWD